MKQQKKQQKTLKKTDFYQNQLDAPTQEATKEKSKYMTMQQKIETMRQSDIKRIATNEGLKDPNIHKLKHTENLIKKV